jgi:hypothetical protein
MAKYGIVSQALRSIHRRNGLAGQDQQKCCYAARVMAGKRITLQTPAICYTFDSFARLSHGG